MARRARQIIEYRVYELSIGFPVLLLDGEQWHISDIKSKRLHFHNCLEIGVCHTNSGTLLVRDEPHTFHAGDVTLLPQHVPHTTYSSRGMTSLWSYLFVDLRELLSEVLHTNEDFELSAFDPCNFIHLFKKDEYPKIHFLASSIIDELKTQQAHYQESTKGLLVSLFFEITRTLKASTNTPPVKKRKDTLVLTPALNYINDNYMRKITVDELAEMCHLSTTHFRRLFFSIMGSNPHNFINQTRVSRACTMLQTTDNAILSIAETVGFVSVSSFNRCFQQMIGMTPRQYRNPERQDHKPQRPQSIVQYRGWQAPDL
ncbi:MAG: helix-turn-helix transcriptional regulator [Clostridiales bacterium]|nr:helix-turn-helix transcriptional regulator [Clostridiales bacterium]